MIVHLVRPKIFSILQVPFDEFLELFESGLKWTCKRLVVVQIVLQVTCKLVVARQIGYLQGSQDS